MPTRNYMGISMDIKLQKEVNLYFDEEHKNQVSKDDAKIIERYEFDDDGVILSHETIKVQK